ncbi:flagella biosynthesis chaperone for FliD, FliT [Shewanella sp. NIFS-20-20]|nr:flagella biosynthesis chaperone for FliD, FliT [Shewanella sp. NIFS-20-20]
MNAQVASILQTLRNIPAEEQNTDDLVSKLQELIERRQKILNVLLADETLVEASFWQAQLQLTQEFSQEALLVRGQRQSLLHAGSQRKRQINMYNDNR